MNSLTFAEIKKALQEEEEKIGRGFENFYHVGMALRRIRDDELYKGGGFESWTEYLKNRWEQSERTARALIQQAELRSALPDLPEPKNDDDRQRAAGGWSRRSVQEFARLPDKKEAARVAKKVIEKAEKEGAKVTANFARKVVDEELGVKRKKPEPKPEPKGIDLRAYLDDLTDHLVSSLKELRKEIPKEGWKLFIEDHPRSVKCLTAACQSMTEFLKEIGR